MGDSGIEWAIGLMSGTSIDGVDAVVAGFSQTARGALEVQLRATHTQPYAPDLHRGLLDVSTRAPATTSLAELADLDAGVGETFASAAVAVLKQSGLAAQDIHAIGSHGQTIFHDPGKAGNSLQIGDPNRIAARTGIATVSDFRRRDIAEGGQGAPLVPAFHHALFARPDKALCIVNIGGIANVTLLPDAAAEHVRGFDTGPGNGLMDEWVARHLGRPFDTDGAWAAGGRVHTALLAALRADPWFAQAPPKSTGRDYFNLGWAAARFPRLDALKPEDVQRSFCELTALSVTEAAHPAGQLLVCGGGVRNTLLMERLRELFHGPVESTAVHGLAPQWVEASSFAWLACRRIAGRPGNVPAVTGARRSAVLGAIYSG